MIKMKEKIWEIVDDAADWQVAMYEMEGIEECNNMGAAAAASLGAQIDNLMEGIICIPVDLLTNGTLYCILKDCGIDVEKYGDDWDSLFENELEKLR